MAIKSIIIKIDHIHIYNDIIKVDIIEKVNPLTKETYYESVLIKEPAKTSEIK